MKIVDIFPKAIGVAQLESLTPDVIKEAIEFIETDGRHVDLESDGAYTREQNLLNKLFFKEVKQEILNNCMEFSQAHSHLVDKLDICNSWGNIIERGQSIRFHRHSNSYISGSFYLTDGSPFNILNTMNENLFGIMPEMEKNHDNYRSFESFSINPIPGRLIIFPSGLHHQVLPSDSIESRYSIAFNAIPIGKIGIPTNYIQLDMPS